MTSCVPTATSKEPVTITYLALEYSDKTEGLMQQEIAAFEKENPNIKVKLEMVSWTSAHDNYMTLASAHQLPDIGNVDNMWIPEFADLNLLEPLAPYISTEFKNSFIPVTLEQGPMYKGKLLGLPYVASTRALIYNTDLLKQAGVNDPPKTWEDILTDAEKVSALPGKYGYILQGVDQDTTFYFYYVLWSYGGKVLDETGHAAFNSPEGIKALTYLVDLVHNHLTQPGVTATNFADTSDLFASGNDAMTISGSWAIDAALAKNPNFNYGVASVPSVVTSGNMGMIDSIVMFNTSKHKQEAYKWLEFEMGDDNMLKFTVQEGALPVKIANTQVAPFKGSPWVEVLPDCNFIPLMPNFDAATNALLGEIDLAYLGTKTPEQALNDAAKEFDQANFGK
jgi:multiple sugar transport system substrate-binding protein